MLEYGDKLLWSEIVSIEEMYGVRGERQKRVLLEKVILSFLSNLSNTPILVLQKIIETGDEQWKMLLERQISRCVDALIT